MSASHVIYSRDYIHKGHEFTVWSYVDGGAMRFGFQCEGFSLAGIDTREEAVRKARQHIDTLPAEPAEQAPAGDASQASQGQQQAEPALV